MMYCEITEADAVNERFGRMSSALSLLAVLALPPCKPGHPPPCPGLPHIKPGCLERTPNQTDLYCPGDAVVNSTCVRRHLMHVPCPAHPPTHFPPRADECYKIPTLLRIPNSTHLLSFIEARRFSCSDAGWIDIVQKTSTDGGRTWGAPQLVVSAPNLVSNASEWHTIGDALPVFDAFTRRIHLIFTRDNEDAFATYSDDRGATWSLPTNLTAVLPIKARGPFCGTGHAAGLQLSQPAGRLLVPMYCQGIADLPSSRYRAPHTHLTYSTERPSLDPSPAPDLSWPLA